jgi:hypothetical protein
MLVNFNKATRLDSNPTSKAKSDDCKALGNIAEILQSLIFPMTSNTLTKYILSAETDTAEQLLELLGDKIPLKLAGTNALYHYESFIPPTPRELAVLVDCKHCTVSSFRCQ